MPDLAASILERLERELGSNHVEVLAFAQKLRACRSSASPSKLAQVLDEARGSETYRKEWEALDRDALMERVESYFKRVRKLGGETGECSAAGVADWLLWQKDTKNFAATATLSATSAHKALLLCRQWIEADEGRSLDSILEIEGRAIAQLGKGAWNAAFVEMCKALNQAIAEGRDA